MRKSIVIIGIALIGLSACKKKKVTNLKEEYQVTYAELVSAGYEDSYELAKALKTTIYDFVDNPTAVNFEASKEAWLAARVPYGQTEAFRFAGGPIDDADGPEGLLNAWPLDEAYIDYVEGDATTGIINDPSVNIEKTILEELNEKGGEENISIGYHAIEFLLWGQDDVNTALKTKGDRPYTDYVVGANGTASNQEKRGIYLKVCADLLVEHLTLMVNEWKEGGAYRTTYLAMDADDALNNVMTGIGVLSKSELAGERIFTALDNQDQEDEHSCFSDNTHQDIILNFQGIENVCLGTYTRTNGAVVSGTSLADVVEKSDEELSQKLRDALAACNASVHSISVPFDYALTLEQPGSTGAINNSINDLRDLGDVIAEVGNHLGLSINTALPE
ncbi:hypothetical protein DNU06_13820 [Putridiphycobacter roseus]|uniref:Imelysin-like domain-containing protein n=1 Tax=Putridiphycobacter roseus TaxID=2219161 RepID=A0A2W1MZY6_9FLAO|nr:imelysin family protein [Putridiphycobacter roseus]PZE16201.1 hypothetical protein DNU06_13820 [Putridiphycobacter roseus]